MKALWAFEPFHQNNNKTQEMYNLLKTLTGSNSNIEVGFVVTRAEPQLNLAFDIPRTERFTSYPLELVKDTLKKAKVPIEAKKIHVLDCETFSNTKAVDCLLKQGRKQKADLIALYTQSRQGFQRFVLGSFAETAIHRSRNDLLLISPEAKVAKKLKKIFYMTDFSPSSLKHLRHTIALCKKVKSELVVFHAAEVIFKWSMDEGNPKIRAYRNKINKMQKTVLSESQRAGVRCSVIINSEVKSTSEVALKIANQEKADLIVVTAKSGPLKALIGGSITRQVVRASQKPVLILK